MYMFVCRCVLMSVVVVVYVCMCKGHTNRKGAVRGKGDKKRAGVEKVWNACALFWSLWVLHAHVHNMNVGVNFKTTSYCKEKEILTMMPSVCTQLLRDQSDHC